MLLAPKSRCAWAHWSYPLLGCNLYALLIYFHGSINVRMSHQVITFTQSRRNKKAAKRFFRKLLKGLHYVPRVIITDKLKSYDVAKREILPGVEHRQHK